MTSLIVFCSLLFVLGLIAGTRLGMWLEARAAVRDLAEERAEEEAGRYVGQLVGPPGYSTYAHAAFAGAIGPPEVAHEWPASVPVFYGRRRPRDAREDPDLIGRILVPEVAHEAWLAHEEQALALAAPETDEEFSARLARAAEEIIAWAGEQAYLVGEHWKRP